MREIKFRGKRLDNGEWVYGYYLSYATDVYSCGEVIGTKDEHYIITPCHEDFNCEHTFEVDPSTVGQYTGLKDKNGAEIYEGDLLENRADTLTNFDGSIRRKLKEDIATVCEVIFEVDHWSRKYVSDTRWNERWNNKGVVSKGMNRTNEFYSVTSNVHDNPELLEVSNV